MNRNYIISLEYINFNSYSASKYWQGFFAAKNLQDSAISKKAYLILQDYFSDMKNFFMLSCVLYFYEHKIQSKYTERVVKKHQDSIKYFLENGLLRKAEGEICEQFAKYKEGLIKFPVELLQISFNADDFLRFLEMYLDLILWRINGPCFLINSASRVAIYPHDEGGFGVISFEENNQLGFDLLNFAEQSGEFNSYRVKNN
ncbi:MAG: hypothetical protein J6M05_03375 [Cardiobacteriaceae bacterium]|nr:hypothetical protein [Cardiobacteriaceae bacterium]